MLTAIRRCSNLVKSTFLKGDNRSRLLHTVVKNTSVTSQRGDYPTLPITSLSKVINEPKTNVLRILPKIDLPPTSFIFENPIKTQIEPTNIVKIEDPGKVIEQQAARLIVIRRRKMKRHKLKKLRKKMKFEWAKVRQRREMRKEKAFQAELMGQIKKAEMFSAEAYASEKIRKANEVLLPKLWRGKRLPEFVIKDLLKKKEEKKQNRLEQMERRKSINLNASDYKWD